MRESAGVMEWWSNGVMQKLSKVESFGFLAFSNTPILQYSRTPKHYVIFPRKAIEISLGSED
jgi:hypothetical protein